MFQRNNLYLLASSVPPVASVGLFFLLIAGEFRLAWICALIIILCAEARVQVGERLPHTALFWIHLLSAVPFFLLLTALAFFAQYEWLEIAVGVFGIVAFCTGAILWSRGVQARVLHLFP